MRGMLQLAFMEMWGEEARHQESECVLRPHSELYLLHSIYIRTVSSYHLLSTLLNQLKLVYGLAVWAEQHAHYTFAPDQSGRKQMYHYTRIAKSLLS